MQCCSTSEKLYISGECMVLSCIVLQKACGQELVNHGLQERKEMRVVVLSWILSRVIKHRGFIYKKKNRDSGTRRDALKRRSLRLSSSSLARAAPLEQICDLCCHRYLTARRSYTRGNIIILLNAFHCFKCFSNRRYLCSFLN